MSTTYDKTLDIRNEQCPLPLVKSSQAVKELPLGDVLRILANDPGLMAVQILAKTAKNIEELELETTQADGEQVHSIYLRRTN
jgi:TusA-related sulfurtransferase